MLESVCCGCERIKQRGKGIKRWSAGFVFYLNFCGIRVTHSQHIYTFTLTVKVYG